MTQYAMHIHPSKHYILGLKKKHSTDDRYIQNKESSNIIPLPKTFKEDSLAKHNKLLFFMSTVMFSEISV